MALIPEHLAGDFNLEPDVLFRVSFIEQNSVNGNSEDPDVPAAFDWCPRRVSTRLPGWQGIQSESGENSQYYRCCHKTASWSVIFADSCGKIYPGNNLRSRQLQLGGKILRAHQKNTAEDTFVFVGILKRIKDRRQNRHRIRTSRALTRGNLSKFKSLRAYSILITLNKLLCVYENLAVTPFSG